MTDDNIYIYRLPYLQMKALCRVLDQGRKWEDLAGHMKYDVQTVQDLRSEERKGMSPSEELLIMWGHLNHTVLELFVLLSRMHHYRAMSCIREFVPIKYHRLIHEGEHNLARHLSEVKIINAEQPKDVGIPSHNFDDRAIVKKTYDDDDDACLTRDDNESLAVVVVVDDDARLKPPNSLSPPPARNGTIRTLTVSDISVVAESAGAIPQISYSDLARATNNWDPNSILGKGGFGTVFKGNWKCTQVAIKRLEDKDSHPDSHEIQIKQSITELHCLNAYRHDNILPLYGYSIEGSQPCLVYQYMSGGCLEQRLRTRDPSKTLSWTKRVNIAIGSARGLQFLHTIGTKPLIHGDIKSANILLDPNDEPKIGDFGLAREGPQSNYTHMKVSRIQGTVPYLPDEFLRAKKFSTKIDTYSFGVVLFEIATGRRAGVRVPDENGKMRDRYLKEDVVKYPGDVLDLKDNRLANGENYFKSLIEIGKCCVSYIPKDRPEMVSVLIQLEKNCDFIY